MIFNDDINIDKEIEIIEKIDDKDKKILDFFILLPKIVRKKLFYCKKYQKRCLLCPYGKQSKCKIQEKLTKTNEKILELMRNDN